MSFSSDLEKFQKKAGLKTSTLVRRISLEVFSRVVRKTPVDTGRARASWQISAGKINPAVAPEGFSGGEAGAEAVVASKMATEAKGDTSVVYITNSLPYAVELERGSSKQAPNGMVATTIQEIQSWISSEANK